MSWVRTGNIRGPNGPAGDRGGIEVFEQASEPVTDVHGAMWITDESIPIAIGPPGPQGPPGPAGPPGSLSADRHQQIVRNSNASGANDYTTTGTVQAAMDAVNLRITKVCQYRPIRLHLRGFMSCDVAMSSCGISLRMDGQPNNGGYPFSLQSAVAGQQIPVNLAWDILPQTGSHYFEPWWSVGVSTTTGRFYARPTLPMAFVWEELPYG